MKEQIKGILALLLCTMIWGSAFVSQSVGMDYIQPFTFQTVRSVIAVLALFPVIWLSERKAAPGTARARWRNPQLWKTGLPCGVALFLASGLQQMGLVYTDPGKAGFITAMYIVLVPILGLFLGQKCGKNIWLAVALAVAGLYLLSALGTSGINLGDLLLMLCALAFAVQITLIDRLGQSLDGLRLNFVQFLVNALLSCAVMLCCETPVWRNILDCAFPLVYTGVFSSGVAYTLQIYGQQRLAPAPASLLMSLESVFAVLCGWAILGQGMSPTELAGCGLVFAGVIVSQFPRKQPS